MRHAIAGPRHRGGGAVLSAPKILRAQTAGPIAIIVPFASGGQIHFVGRLLAGRLARILGEPVVVRNLPGQGGLAGSCLAGEAAPDGRTLLLAPNGVYAVALNIASCRFGFRDTFAPLGLLATTPPVLCVSAESGLRSLGALTRAARTAPGALRYITTQRHHLPMLLLADTLEISLTGVLVGGAQAGLEAMARGEAQLALLELGAAMPNVSSGRLRALGIAAAARVPQLPEVPALGEVGLPGFEIATDYARFTRAGTPEAILDRLERASIAAFAGPDVQGLLSPIGVQVLGGNRAGFPAYFEAENSRWLALIQQFDITSMEQPR